MIGGFYDPLAYWSLLGIVLTLALSACRCRNALFFGMVFTLAATFLEGFWVIPAAPFFLPEGLENSFGRLTCMAGTDKELWLIILTSLCLPVCLSAVNGSSIMAFAPDIDKSKQCQGGWPAKYDEPFGGAAGNYAAGRCANLGSRAGEGQSLCYRRCCGSAAFGFVH